MDFLEETIESIANNFINGNLSVCKRQLQELGKECPMRLVYVVLQLSEIVPIDDFCRWISKNIEE